MIDLSDSDDFHDGNLLALELDVATRVLTCRLDAFLSMVHPRTRTGIVVRCRNVRAISATADLQEVQDHVQYGGNISHWSPCRGFNAIFLAGEAVTFDAEEFEVELAG